MSLVSDIKLIRTDTTLDLSQKAEKGMNQLKKQKGLYSIPQYQRIGQWIWDNKNSHLICLRLFAFFLQAGCCPVWFLFCVWKGRLKTSPRFSSSLVFSQANKECKPWSGLTVWSPEKGLFFASEFYPCKNLAFLSLVMQKAKEMRPWLLVMVHLSPWQWSFYFNGCESLVCWWCSVCLISW